MALWLFQVLNSKMLFQFHPHFDGYTPEDWLPFAEHLTNLLDAHRAGRHIYFGSRQHLGVLADCDFLGHVALKTVHEISTRHIDLQALQKSLPRIVEICDFSKHAPSAASARIQSIVVGDLLHRPTLEECNILVEHGVNDGAFWQLIFDALALTKSRGPQLAKLRFVHGGGGSMCDIVEDRIKSGVPVYCLLDSDRRSKYGKLGSTASAAESKLAKLEVIDKNEYGVSKKCYRVGFRILSVREAENLIPLEIVREVLNAVRDPSYSIVERIVPSQPSLSVSDDLDIWAYYDLKANQDASAITFGCAGEKRLFDLMVARIGGQVLPQIRGNLLEEFVRFCRGRHESRHLRMLARALEASPFLPIIEEIAHEIWVLGCRTQSRFT